MKEHANKKRGNKAMRMRRREGEWELVPNEEVRALYDANAENQKRIKELIDADDRNKVTIERLNAAVLEARKAEAIAKDAVAGMEKVEAEVQKYREAWGDQRARAEEAESRAAKLEKDLLNMRHERDGIMSRLDRCLGWIDRVQGREPEGYVAPQPDWAGFAPASFGTIGKR